MLATCLISPAWQAKGASFDPQILLKSPIIAPNTCINSLSTGENEMAIYMKIKGIDGDVTEQNHKDWIRLDSLAWGATTGGNETSGGSASSRGATKPHIKNITVAKMQLNTDVGAAITYANRGYLVVAGLKKAGHGHVMPHSHEPYPTGYSGRLGGIGRKDQTINWAWNRTDLEQVQYFARQL
jgi:hypothetical protein